MNRSKKHFSKNRFKIKKIFPALLLSYSALLAVPFLIVAILMILWTNSVEQYYEEQLNINLTSGRQVFEKELEFLEAKAYSLNSGNTLSWVSSLGSLEPGSTEIVTLIQCGDKIREALVDSARYDNYCVVTKNDFIFTYNSMYIGRDYFWESYRSYEDLSFEEWQEISFESSNSVLLPMQWIQTNESPVEAVTFSYPIRGGFRSRGTADAVVQFVITRENLTDMFSEVLNLQGSVSLFDQNGTLLAIISSDEEAEQIAFEELPAAAESGYAASNIDGQLVLRQDSADGTLVLAASLPVDTAMVNLRRMQTTAWIVLAIAVLFEVFLGCRFAMHYSVPIRNIVDNMQRLFAAESSASKPEARLFVVSEYEFLEEGFNALMDRNQAMRRLLQEKSAHEKQYFMERLLGGEFRTQEELDETRERAGLALAADAYYVLIFHAELDREELLHYLEEKAYPYFEAKYWIDESRLAVLVSCDDNDPEATDKNRQELLEGIEQSQMEQVYVGAGKVYRDRLELMYSFRQALYCVDKAYREQLRFVAMSEKNPVRKGDKTQESRDRLKKYLDEHYDQEQFGLSVAAEEFGLSESYFSIFFKEVMGCSFSSYLENLRLEKAKELIREGQLDLETISSRVGYGSSATFRRAFKRIYGVSPSNWKA